MSLRQNASFFLVNPSGEVRPLPHVHVQFRDGSRVSLAIETGALLAGHVSPRKRLEPVRTWIEAHREVLLLEYRRLNP